jgi:hypothetical protein
MVAGPVNVISRGQFPFVRCWICAPPMSRVHPMSTACRSSSIHEVASLPDAGGAGCNHDDSSQHHNSADYEQTQPARAKRSRRRV